MNRSKELQLYKKGFTAIVGLDEAGRGPLAGPIVAGAVVLPIHISRQLLLQLNDSKKIKPAKRIVISELIKKECAWSVGIVSAKEIDTHGIAHANRLAFQRALQTFDYDYVLVDYFKDIGIDTAPVQGITKGDATIASIAAASIIAKVHRDDLMQKLAKKYPQYGFEKHVGYGTKQHHQAIVHHGLCSEHRRSFCKKYK